ncbi:hypothetical protein [Streptomyces sp. NPDC005303]|uniref:hypothetical protein n=1 Tax=Streptomyces sp. NPDC005303 TaxID=3155713 RepID=UPI0033A95EC2
MAAPVYGDVQITRHLGIGIKVDTAPRWAKMHVDILGQSGLYILIEDGDVVIADQVVYRITGYDPDDRTLTLELLTDWRPGQKDDPNAEKQT